MYWRLYWLEKNAHFNLHHWLPSVYTGKECKFQQNTALLKLGVITILSYNIRSCRGHLRICCVDTASCYVSHTVLCVLVGRVDLLLHSITNWYVASVSRVRWKAFWSFGFDHICVHLYYISISNVLNSWSLVLLYLG